MTDHAAIKPKTSTYYPKSCRIVDGWELTRCSPLIASCCVSSALSFTAVTSMSKGKMGRKNGGYLSILVTTERLCLRRIEESDLPSLGRIYADPECMRFYPGTKSPPEIRTWFQKLAFNSYDRHGFGLWCVIDASSGEVIGDCGITLQETPAGPEPEIGYHLWRDFWGNGFASEAAIACRDYAFHSLGLPKVVSIVSPENTPSQKVAQRVHDRKEVYRKQLGESGVFVDRYLYISDKR